MKMTKLLVLALLVCYIEPKVVTEKCPGPIKYIEKEVLKNNLDSPYQLAIDYNRSNLFFSFTRIKNGRSIFESAFINLKTNEFQIINGIKGGFANTVDEENHIVYLGGQNGIYQLDYNTNTAKHVDGSQHKIWQLFFKKDLYYTKYPEEEVYTFKNGKPQRLPQLTDTRGLLVAVDNNDNIYFSNSSGLFILEKSNDKSTAYLGDYNINSFTADINGHIFFSTPNGIFSIDDVNRTVKELVLLDDVYGVAIERDGSLIYSSEDSIIKIKAQCTNT